MALDHASAVVYGVLASTRYNLLLLVMGDGAGVLTDNKTGKPTYMKMACVGKGLLLDGNVSPNPMLSIYQITDTGVVLQANRGGVAYLPDAALNR